MGGILDDYDDDWFWHNRHNLIRETNKAEERHELFFKQLKKAKKAFLPGNRYEEETLCLYEGKLYILNVDDDYQEPFEDRPGSEKVTKRQAMKMFKLLAEFLDYDVEP